MICATNNVKGREVFKNKHRSGREIILDISVGPSGRLLVMQSRFALVGLDSTLAKNYGKPFQYY